MKDIDSAGNRLAQYALADIDEIRRDLALSRQGRREEEIGAVRERYGTNDISGTAKDTVRHRLRRSFVNPFSLVLCVLAVISFLTDYLAPAPLSRNATTSSIVLTMLLASGLIRFMQEMHAKEITDRLIRLVHTTIRVYRDGCWQDLPAEQLVVGDTVYLEAGDRVPADIRLTKTVDLFVSQSAVSGESGILEKDAAPLHALPALLTEYKNTIFLGSVVTGGSCEGIVAAVGSDTAYGGVSPESLSRKLGFDRGENAIAWVLIKCMILLVPVVFVACGITKGDWLASFLFSLSVAVGLTPELLPMVITACLAKGSFQMGRKQTVVKNINAMQGLGSMDILCVDKTGTLTGDTVLLEYYMDILGNESQDVLQWAFLNSYYHTGVANHLDKAIIKALDMPGKKELFAHLLKTYQKLDEMPFDYSRKFASVLVSDGKDSLLLVKGSIDEVVSRCRYVSYQGKLFPAGRDAMKNVHATVDDMLEEGMKVLAVASKRLHAGTLRPEDEYELTLLGYLAFFDAPKNSAESAIRKLRDLQVDITVLTGDHASVAVSVCRRLGIPTASVLTGTALKQLKEVHWPDAVRHTRIFAELSPSQKSKIVEELQHQGHTVGFLGDGMNDLPAVIQADVGISVDTAAESVQESADIILLKKDLNVLEQGVLEGRKAFANMSKYIKITASSNIGNIISIVVASVFLPFLPMTSVQLLLLNLLYDVLCLVLPWDNVDRAVYERTVEWSGRTLGRFMSCFGPISSLFDMITFGFLFFFLGPLLCGAPFSALDRAGQAHFIAVFQTGWFLESMWTQVLILHLLRTRRISFWKGNPSRPVVLVTILGILLFTALAVTPVGSALGLTALPLVYFLFLLSIVAVYLLIVTIAKWLYGKRYGELT